LRDHDRRLRGDQGAGHRPVRPAVQRGRVRGPGLRLSPPGRERRAAAPAAADPGAARRLAGRDRPRPGAARSRPGQARDLELFRFGRPRVPHRSGRSGRGRGDCPDTVCRRPGGVTQRGTAPEAGRHASLRRAGHRRRRRRPGRPSAEAGAAHRGAGSGRDAHHAGQQGRRPGARSGRQVSGVAAGGRRPFGPPPFFLPAGKVRGPGPVPAAGPGLRPDQSVLAGPAVRAAGRAPRAELVRMPGGHYEPFLGGHERAVEAELSFLRRHLLGEPAASRPTATAEPAGRPA